MASMAPPQSIVHKILAERYPVPKETPATKERSDIDDAALRMLSREAQ